jgi:hypothetical protein
MLVQVIPSASLSVDIFILGIEPTQNAEMYYQRRLQDKGLRGIVRGSIKR